MKTNLKELIAQAGFKSQVEFARRFEKTEKTIYRWHNNPPRSIVRELNLIIECNELRKENMKLLSDLNTIKQWIHPES